MRRRPRDKWYVHKGVLGVLGMLGMPPFNILAWYLAERDLRAPDFHQMPGIYQERVRIARKMGKVGTYLMVCWIVLMAVMTTINAVREL